MSKMEKWKKKSRTANLPIKLFQVVNGIISVVLGLLTFTFRRPHKYVDGGIYSEGYPFSGSLNDIVPQESKSFLPVFSPVLVAGVVAIANSIFLLKSRLNREIKLWVKFVIIFVNFAWLIVVALIPSHLLPIMEHPVFFPMATYYGVFHRKKFRNKYRNILYYQFRISI